MIVHNGHSVTVRLEVIDRHSATVHHVRKAEAFLIALHEGTVLHAHSATVHLERKDRLMEIVHKGLIVPHAQVVIVRRAASDPRLVIGHLVVKDRLLENARNG